MVDLDLFLQRERLITQPLAGADRWPSSRSAGARKLFPLEEGGLGENVVSPKYRRWLGLPPCLGMPGSGAKRMNFTICNLRKNIV